MYSVNIMGLILTLGGLIFLIAGYIQHRFPPKKINHLYGYRTSASMKSQESWDFAQEYSAKKVIKIARPPMSGTASWCCLRSVGTSTSPTFLASGASATMATSVQKKAVSDWTRSGDILAPARCARVIYSRNRYRKLNKFKVKVYRYHLPMACVTRW